LLRFIVNERLASPDFQRKQEAPWKLKRKAGSSDGAFEVTWMSGGIAGERTIDWASLRLIF